VYSTQTSTWSRILQCRTSALIALRASSSSIEGVAMSNRVRERTPELHAPESSAASPEPHRTVRSLRIASLTAGVALLLMSAFAAVGYVAIVQRLVTPGDPVATATDIVGSTGLFRLGVAMLYAVIILDVLVAWALLGVFTPVNRNVSRLAAWFRVAYAAVFMVAISHLAGVPDLLSNTGYSTAFTPEQLQGQAMVKVETFHDTYMAGLILFGVHLLILGYLVYKSGYVPKVIGVLLTVAGVGYIVDSVVTVFTEGTPFTISTVTFLGEFLLALWLLMRGRRLTIPPVTGARSR
jgi:hypothetical protein